MLGAIEGGVQKKVLSFYPSISLNKSMSVSSDDQRINMEFLEFEDKFSFLQDEADTYGMEKKFGKIQMVCKK